MIKSPIIREEGSGGLGRFCTGRTGENDDDMLSRGELLPSAWATRLYCVNVVCLWDCKTADEADCLATQGVEVWYRESVGC